MEYLTVLSDVSCTVFFYGQLMMEKYKMWFHIAKYICIRILGIYVMEKLLILRVTFGIKLKQILTAYQMLLAVLLKKHH